MISLRTPLRTHLGLGLTLLLLTVALAWLLWPPPALWAGHAQSCNDKATQEAKQDCWYAWHQAHKNNNSNNNNGGGTSDLGSDDRIDDTDNRKKNNGDSGACRPSDQRRWSGRCLPKCATGTRPYQDSCLNEASIDACRDSGHDWIGNRCVEKQSPGQNRCRDSDYRWSSSESRCVDVIRNSRAHTCTADERWDNAQNRCVPSDHPGKNASKCPPGFSWNSYAQDCERSKKKSGSGPGSPVAPLWIPDDSDSTFSAWDGPLFNKFHILTTQGGTDRYLRMEPITVTPGTVGSWSTSTGTRTLYASIRRITLQAEVEQDIAAAEVAEAEGLQPGGPGWPRRGTQQQWVLLEDVPAPFCATSPAVVTAAAAPAQLRDLIEPEPGGGGDWEFTLLVEFHPVPANDCGTGLPPVALQPAAASSVAPDWASVLLLSASPDPE